MVGAGRCLDLEVDGLADIDALVGGESLDRLIAGAGHAPIRRRVAGLGVFARHRADHWHLAGMRAGRWLGGLPSGSRVDVDTGQNDRRMKGGTAANT